MTSFRLGIVIVALLVAIGLAMTNPTMDEYLRFVEHRLGAALEKMDQSAPDREKTMLRSVFRAQGKRLIEGIIRPATTRVNWGFWSLYRTNVLDTEIIVLGVASWFVPLSGVEEATIKIGRLAF
ncbi:MAG TPA: DUF4359 domain-containing protein [Nitrospiraceae bacterium]|nr:DUF4359 domain-containing protein [Nitrospiraceae bacterium]